MAIDPAKLAQQRAVFLGTVKPPRAEAPESGRWGRKMSTTRCPRCRERFLAVKNASGICHVCHRETTPRQRFMLHHGIVELAKRRATAATIERARQRLAERGIAV